MWHFSCCSFQRSQTGKFCASNESSAVATVVVVEEKKTRNRVRKNHILLCAFCTVLLYESIATSVLEGSNSVVFKTLSVRWYKFLLTQCLCSPRLMGLRCLGQDFFAWCLSKLCFGSACIMLGLAHKRGSSKAYCFTEVGITTREEVLDNRKKIFSKYFGSIQGQDGRNSEQPGASLGKWLSHHTWKCPKNEEVWHSLICFSGHGGVWSEVQLDLGVLFPL